MNTVNIEVLPQAPSPRTTSFRDGILGLPADRVVVDALPFIVSVFQCQRSCVVEFVSMYCSESLLSAWSEEKVCGGPRLASDTWVLLVEGKAVFFAGIGMERT